MSAQPNWQDPAAPLKKLAARLVIDPMVFEANEGAGTLAWRDENFRSDKALQLELADLNPLVETYGVALNFKFYLGQMPVLQVDNQLTEAKLDEFRRIVDTSPMLIFDLRLDKTKLLELWGAGPDKNAVVKLFLFPGALIRMMSEPLVRLEEELLKEADGSSKILILVPQHDIVLDGEYLAIVGLSAIEHWRDFLPHAAPNQQLVQYMCSQAKSLKWTFFNLEILTPRQLFVSEPKDKKRIHRDDALALVLYEKLIELTLIFTADQTMAPDAKRKTLVSPAGAWNATYAAESYKAEIAFGQKDALKETLVGLNSTSYAWELPLTLASMSLWAYAGEQDRHLGQADRIHVLQGVIAHGLQGNDPVVNYREIVRQAGHFKEEVEWGWAAFVEGKLTTYFARVRDVEQAVDLMVKGFSEQVQALTKVLTDNMLAAVGVVVGSFIAAVVNDKFNPFVFRLGLIVYSVYLFCFPGIIGLLSTWQRFRDSLNAFDKQKAEFGKRLFPKEVEQIVGTTVQKSERWFKNWVLASAFIYLVVIILLVLAALLVPRRIGTP